MKVLRKTMYCLMASSTILCFGCGDKDADIETALTLPPGGEVVNEESNPSPQNGGWRLNDGGISFLYSKYFKRDLLFSHFEYGVDVFTQEFYDDTWHNWQKSFTTSFAIEKIRGRTSEELVVGGYDEQSGETVFEGWKMSTPDGGYLSERIPVTKASIGVSIPFSTQNVDIVGGEFIKPVDRTIVAPPQKQVLYRGTDLRIRDFVIDPEGRYLLVHDDTTGGFYQIIGQQAFLVGDPQTHPLLLKAHFPRYYQHSNLDRVLVFMTESPYPQQVIVFHDSDNDGVIEFIGQVGLVEFGDLFEYRRPITGEDPDYILVR